MSELTEEQKLFLLSIPDDFHSDYDDSLDGWSNYRVVSGGELFVKFQSSEGEILEGWWKLTFLKGSSSPVPSPGAGTTACEVKS